MANVKQLKQKTSGTLLDIEDAQARKDIASEVINRTNADKALDDKIKAEAEARTNADNALQEEIAELNDKKITKFYTNNLGETTLNDSDNGKIQDMMLYGKSEQKQYSGRNLLKPILETTTVNGVTCTKNGDGTYTLNGTATDNVRFHVGTIWNMVNTNLRLCGCPSRGSVDTYCLIAFGALKDIGNGQTYNVWLAESPVTINVNSGVTVNNIVFKPMVSLDTSLTYDDYEPYVGGIPSPNPDYPQEIKSVVNPKLEVCGKNLFNPDSLVENGACTYSNDEIKVVNVNKLANITVPLSIKAGNNINLSFYVKGVKEQSFIVGLKYTNGNKQGITISINANEFVYNSKTINLSEDLEGIFFGGSGGLGNGTIIKKLQIEIGSQSTEYEPYKEQTATLPYTLNAIPVSSGGNVTIDGQEYIADYVDVENKKLVRMTNKVILSKDSMPDLSPEVSTKNTSVNIFESLYSSIGMSDYKYNGVTNITPYIVTNGMIVSKLKARTDFSNPSWKYLDDGEFGTNSINNKNVPNNWMMFATSKASTSEEFKELFDGTEIVYQINKKEINLTDEEVEAFKELATYYPTTNVFITSEQLDGYTTFNYPLSMANGWNLIKEQIGDTREYIYDMELQSAEAYVNSEYAVTLTELGV